MPKQSFSMDRHVELAEYTTKLEKRVRELETALRWADELYSNYSLVAQPIEGIGLKKGPGAWISHVRNLLRK